MRRTRFDQDQCPIARTTDLLGDWWTPMVMRSALFGCSRFEQFQAALGVSRTTLTQRLNRLVDEGMLERVPYQTNPVRHEYKPTTKGREFFDVLAVMWTWGDRWMFEGGPEGDGAVLRFADKETGETIRPTVIDDRTGSPINLRSVRVRRKSSAPSPQ
jgi:DNA-binding HxlR family transcriptional regulator